MLRDSSVPTLRHPTACTAFLMWAGYNRKSMLKFPRIAREQSAVWWPVWTTNRSCYV